MVNTAIAKPDYFKGLILLAPAMITDYSQQKLLKKILPLVACFSGRWNIPVPSKGLNACKNPAAVEENMKDKGIFSKTKPKSLKNTVNMI